MKFSREWQSLFIAGLILLAGCSSSKTVSPPGGVPLPGTSAFSVSITDAPPPNVTIFSFEVNVTAAVLHSTTGKPDVSLVSTPVQIEIKHLETEAAFLSAANVPDDTYKEIAITFSSPELTFKNETGGTLLGCPTGQVCEVKPNVPPTVVTIATNPPFPLTTSSGSPAGLEVDVRLDTLLDSALNINFGTAGAVTVTKISTTQGNEEVGNVDDLKGVVDQKDAGKNQFLLKTLRGNFTIKVDDKTEFDDFDKATPPCLTNNFACVQNGQVVDVDVRMMTTLPAGMFLAKEVELENDQLEDELEGIVSGVVDATHFNLVVAEEIKDITGVAVGNPIAVTLSSATFGVDLNGLTVPTGLLNAFQNANDTSQLLPGQRLKLRVKPGSVSGTPPNISLQTDRVRLERSRFTGNVAGAPVPPNFNVNNLPTLFGPSPGTTIQVQTSSKTKFAGGVSGVSGLIANDRVSVRGLLFKSTPNNTLIADKVRKR